jgi:hypothetical protein
MVRVRSHFAAIDRQTAVAASAEQMADSQRARCLDGFPCTHTLLSQVAGVPVDDVTLTGPATALGNAMHVACVGAAIACALAAARSID